ncbi:MAG: HD domain-containing protein [Puniceicoccales bacterium]|jgi:guanosine-3',5'-bis(diphosphate) 3'-pyrophosphohydrolase|nr:HD domain-containing protein [Puniceicoccales bacterium]
MKRLLHATHFAAEKHSNQRRKNTAAAPYINHPIEVALHLATVGNVTNEDWLAAAVLHDTIEDTDTSREEIAGLFGETVASLVCECTDDKSLPKAERKRLQVVNAAGKSVGAKLIKIADKSCNLRSMLADPPKGWSTSRQLQYFVWAREVIRGMLGHNQALDEEAQRILAEGISRLSHEE